MRELDLLLKLMQGANILAPGVVSLVALIKKGRAEGKTDEEIQEESMTAALDTREITSRDMSNEP